MVESTVSVDGDPEIYYFLTWLESQEYIIKHVFLFKTITQRPAEGQLEAKL